MQVPPIFIGSYACTVHCIYTATFAYSVLQNVDKSIQTLLIFRIQCIFQIKLEIFVSAKAELNVVFMCNFNINL